MDKIKDDQDVSIFAVLTFPGVIIHELGHKLFCDLFNVRILDVCYFRFGNPLGYVIHEKPKHYIQTFFICIGPFIVGSILSLAFFLIAVYLEPVLYEYFFGWLAISFAVHVFPSSADVNILWDSTNDLIRSKQAAILYLIPFYPIILLMYITSTRFRLVFVLYYPIMLYQVTLWLNVEVIPAGKEAAQILSKLL